MTILRIIYIAVLLLLCSLAGGAQVRPDQFPLQTNIGGFNFEIYSQYGGVNTKSTPYYMKLYYAPNIDSAWQAFTFTDSIGVADSLRMQFIKDNRGRVWYTDAQGDALLLKDTAQAVGNVYLLPTTADTSTVASPVEGDIAIVGSDTLLFYETYWLMFAGGGGGDNLGNHYATQDLNMQFFDIEELDTLQFGREPTLWKIWREGTGDYLYITWGNPSSTDYPLRLNPDGSVRLGGDDGYDMPTADGTAGQVLTTDGSGAASWGAAGSGVSYATYVVASSTSAGSADYTCDGTDDHVQIQQAIDALGAEGGKIVLLEGVFNLTDTVILTDEKKIIIEGQGGATIVKPNTRNVPAFARVSSTTTGFGNEEEIVFRDMRIESATETKGIYIYNAHLWTVENMVFVGDSLTGVYLRRANNGTITNNFFNKVRYGVYGDGGSVVGDDIEDVKISNNDFSYCGKSAIHIESSSPLWQRQASRLNIVSNNIEESDYEETNVPAVYLKRVYTSTITANAITQTYRGGAIELDSCIFVTVSSNSFRENGNDQAVGDSTSTILLTSSDSCLIVANTITDEYTDRGIVLLDGSDANTVYSNYVSTEIGGINSIVNYGDKNIIQTFAINPAEKNKEYRIGGRLSVSSSVNNSRKSLLALYDTDTDNARIFSYDYLNSTYQKITFNDDVTTEQSIASPKPTVAFGISSDSIIYQKGSIIGINGQGVSGSYLESRAAGGGAGILTYGFGGTQVSPTKTVADQFIGLWSARGHDNSALVTSARGYFAIRAKQDWASGDTPTYIAFATTPDASATAAERLRIDDDGQVGVGTTDPKAQLHVNGSLSRNAPVTKTGNFSLAATENWVIVNNASANTTVTLPAASTWTGREVMLKNLSGTYTVISASSNVVPIDGTSAGTAILPATAGAWCTLVSDGTNWVIMQKG